MPVLIVRAIRAAATEFKRTFALDGWERPDEVYEWQEHVQVFADVLRETGLRIVGGLNGYLQSPPNTLWRVTLHREPLGDGRYRYLSGVATCVNDDRVRDVLRLEPVE